MPRAEGQDEFVAFLRENAATQESAPHAAVLKAMAEFYNAVDDEDDYSAWYLGDRINGMLMDDRHPNLTLEAIHRQLTAQGEADMTLPQLRVLCEVALHFPPNERRLDKNHVWHFEQWALATQPVDGLRRRFALERETDYRV